MAPVTLPASFYNSFWSPDYRTGLEVLFKQLDKVRSHDQDLRLLELELTCRAAKKQMTWKRSYPYVPGRTPRALPFGLD